MPFPREREAAYTPSAIHTCSSCGHQFVGPGRLRKMVANPLPAILEGLATMAPRKPQQHRLDLRPETLCQFSLGARHAELL